MTFEHPAMLWLLAVVPLVVVAVVRRRREELGAARALALGASVAGAVLFAVLAAAGPSRRGAAPAGVRGAVVADVSASMGEAGLARVNEVLRAAGRDPAVIARIVFAGAPRPATGEVALAPEAEGSDPAAALEAAAAALGAFPAGTRRVFLLSDGGQTAGDVLRAAARLADAGIAVDVGLAGEPRAAWIASIDVPPVAGAGERILVRARVAASSPVEARVALLAGGREVSARELPLEPGERPIELPWRTAAPGVHRLAVTLAPRDGAAPDRVDSLVEVLPAPRTLVVSDGESSAARALGEAGIGVAQAAAEAWPEDLRGFDAVVLDGVDAEALGEARIASLAAFVRGGGGLVAVPGPKGLAQGGADASRALRRILPMATVDDEKKEPPPVGLIFILDRSDSMARERKWEVAAKTTASAYHDLNPTSTVGLLVFSDFTDWVVPLSLVKDVPDFPKKVAAIRLQGGTDMFPSVKEAFRALAPLDVRKKHVVLLSDGVSTSRLAEHRALVEEMAAARVTVSTVAMGSEADQPTMAEIARITGGRYWYVADPDDLPRIFAEETRSFALEDDEAPVAAVERKEIPAFASLDPERALWTRTTRARARATSETLWQVADGRPVKRPLLARARLGAGRAVALAAPIAEAPLARGELAAAMLRASVAAPAESLGIRAGVRRAGPGASRVTLARIEPGTLAEGLRLEVLREDGTVESRADLEAEAADRAAVVIEHRGARLGRILSPEGRPAAWVALAADRSERAPWPESLGAIAGATGGAVVPPGALPAWMGRAPPRPERPAGVPLGLSALALAVAGVWLRRPPAVRSAP